MMMHKGVRWMAVAVLLLLMVQAVAAQAVEPVPVPTDSVAVYVLAGVVIALLAVIVFIGRPLIVQLGMNVPAVVLESVVAAVQTLLDAAARQAATTESKLDDESVAELRKQFEALKVEIERLRAASGHVEASG